MGRRFSPLSLDALNFLLADVCGALGPYPKAFPAAFLTSAAVAALAFAALAAALPETANSAEAAPPAPPAAVAMPGWPATDDCR